MIPLLLGSIAVLSGAGVLTLMRPAGLWWVFALASIAAAYGITAIGTTVEWLALAMLTWYRRRRIG